MTDHHHSADAAKVIVSIGTIARDGAYAESWTICECIAEELRKALGKAHRETMASRDAIERVADGILDVPGVVRVRHTGGEAT